MSALQAEENTKESPEQASKLAFMLRALQYPNYRLFFGGQLVSLLGSWMTQIATTWLVYRLTGSALLLGAVAFAGQIPAFLLGPIAGVSIDRVNRHRLLVITQSLAMLQSFGLAYLAFSGHASIAAIIALLAFQGLINAFDMPARQAFVIELIENKEDLSNAIALNSSMFNIARLAGPSIGGLLIASVGEGWCFLIDGISYIGVIGCLLAMKVPAFVPKLNIKKPLQELKEGTNYAFGFAPIRSLIFLMGAMSLVGMPYAVLMPVIAKETMSGGANTLGFLMAASGSGALCAALVLAARQSVRGLGKLIPFCTIGFGVALLAFSQTSVLWLALPLLFLMGFAMMTQNAACNTLLQTIVESDKRGRVMSLYTMAFMGLAPFGSLWAGALAQKMGAPVALVVSAAGSILAGLWFASQLPSLREDIVPIYQKLGIIPAVASGMSEESQLAAPPQRAG
ncbi:putative arabinose efflux permease, MFS family [Abditibacterium utsteinense]|uniref:Putative arabinose efflux permease, MFS family n=1 Tax=Abditibacterium utsteinense TaxID=1960156 RepID=A0A2S8SRY7_9BACT|nr:MFS transporter [Abditibacterium utsteinense]PQV63574.1 putative arabinose efflux permease, MFS family [Abditibacterium utsteinense]